MTSDIAFASLLPSAEFTMSTLMSPSPSALATPKPTVRATTRCGALTPPMRRPLPVQHDLTTPRARARAARLRAYEAAERREDLAALVTTPVSHLSPLSFVSSDVDGRTRTQYDTNGFHCSSCLLLSLLAQCCLNDMTDVRPLPSFLGAMGALAPLVRRRENGIRRSRWDVVACTNAPVGISSSGRRSKARTTILVTQFYFCRLTSVGARR